MFAEELRRTSKDGSDVGHSFLLPVSPFPCSIGASRPLLLEPCGVEPLRRHPSFTTAGETISIVEVENDEELDGSVEGVTQSFASKEEASLTITISLPSLTHPASGEADVATHGDDS